MQREQPALFDYGIQNECSDIRVHVSPVSRRLYVFPTAEAQKLLEAHGHEYPDAGAGQPGVDYETGRGKLVPYVDIPRLVVVNLETEVWWAKFKYEHSTRVKGRKAVAVVCWALRNGKLPLWTTAAKETTSIKLDKKGVDVLFTGQWKIQVKCDWKAGLTGNLFLQTAEANPLKQY